MHAFFYEMVYTEEIYFEVAAYSIVYSSATIGWIIFKLGTCMQ